MGVLEDVTRHSELDFEPVSRPAGAEIFADISLLEVMAGCFFERGARLTRRRIYGELYMFTARGLGRDDLAVASVRPAVSSIDRTNMVL